MVNLSPPAPEPTGTAAYELIERIGVGGMAETFLAERRGPGGYRQRVCLKRVLPAFSRDPAFLRLFHGEAQISARILHANIARVVDFGVEDGQYFLALEMVEGLDLRQALRQLRLEGRQLPTEAVLLITLGLLEALDFAHSADAEGRVRGVVHRDVSPSNVLLSRSGEVKLTDFGIAKAMSEATSTRTHAVKGKVPYMAPEYALGGRFGAASDLFSLGVLLYETLGGERPYDGASEVDTLQRAERGEHLPLSSLAPDAPPRLLEIVESMLRPSPLERPLDAREALDMLAPLAPPWRAEPALGALIRELEAAIAEPSVTAFKTESVSPPKTLALPDPSAAREGATMERGEADSPTRTRR